MATDGAPAFGRGMTVSPLFCLSHRNCEWLPSTAATGPLEARRRRTYRPTFKLLLSGNHRPSLRNVDEAMRRRLHLVPFTETIPPSERDPQLSEKLRREYPGILAWMIRGCVAWQSVGLMPPTRVKAATEDYFAAEDSLAAWLAERCVTAPNLTATTSALFADWRTWAEKTGEWVGSEKRFAQRLDDRGFRRTRNVGPRRVRGFSGLGLASEAS